MGEMKENLLLPLRKGQEQVGAGLHLNRFLGVIFNVQVSKWIILTIIL